MTMTDPLGDMLTRIRNAQRAGMQNVSCPASKLRANVLEVLKREGYIRGFTPSNVIREINRISKPGRRVYSKIADLPRVYNGLGISILSTPRGVMSDSEARAANVGGEVLCRVY
jgi:small subunit ribosomal protein S8